MNIQTRETFPVVADFGIRNSEFGFSNAAYLLTETLVYIGVLFVVLGLGYALMYRCVDNSMALRRNADDIAQALRAGEQWRADVRSAAPARWETNSTGQILRLRGARGEVAYRFSEGAVSRRVGSDRWMPLLSNVKSSMMEADPRQKVTSFRWELELQPRAKSGRVRPLFTFISVLQGGPAK